MTPPQTIKEHPSTVPLKIRQLSHNHKVLSSAVTGQRSFIACAQPNDILTMKIDAGGMVPTRKYDKMVFKKKKSQAIAQQVSTTKRTAEKEEDKVKGLAPAVNMGRVKRGLEWDWAQQGKSGADPPKSPMTAWRNRRKQEGEAKEEAYLADLQTTTQNSSARLFAGLTPQDFIPIVLPAHLKALVLEQRRAPPPVVFEEVLSPSAVFLGATPRTDIRLMREAPRCDMGAPRFTPNASLELEKDLSVYEDALLEREGAAAASVAASLVRTVHGGSVEMTRSKDTSIWAVAPAGRRRVSTAAPAAHSLTTPRGGASRMSSSSSSRSSSSRAATAVGVGTGGSRLGTFDRSVLSRSGEGCGGATTRMAMARTTGGSPGTEGLEVTTSVWSRGSSRSTLGAHPVGSQRSKVCDSSGNSFVDAGPGPHGRFPTVTSPQRLTKRNVERGVLWRPGVKDYTFGARTYGEPEELSSSSSSSSSFYGGGGGDRGAFSCLENGSSTAGEGGLDRRKAVTGGSGDENWGGDSLETTLRRRTVRGIVGDVFTDEEGPVPTVPTGWASDGGGGNGGDTTPPAPLTPRGQTTPRLEPLLALASPSPSSPPFASTAASEMPFSPVTVTARHRTRGPAPAAAAAADSFFAKSNSFGPHVSAAAFVRNWKRENDIYTPDGPQTSTSKAKSFRG